MSLRSYLIPFSVFVWVPSVAPQAPPQRCVFTQAIDPGKVYALNSPGFPGLYVPFTTCIWTAYGSTPKVAVNVECSAVHLAKNSGGQCLDHLMISIENQIVPFCEPFKVSASRIEMRLTATTRRGGYFRCTFSGSEGTPAPTSTIQSHSNYTSVTVSESHTELPPIYVPPPLKGCDCGWNRRGKRNRIVGGEDAELHEFPSMAAFLHMKTRSIWCGATIITRTTVLTAAHCTAGRNAHDYGLLIGEHDLNTGKDTSETSLVRVKGFKEHENYNPRTQENDIAIAIAEQELVESDHVGPACLPFNYPPETNSLLTVTGWGADSFGGLLSDVLKKVDVRIVQHEYCVRTYDAYDPPKQLCTYERGKDACQYDSGGPMYAYNSEGRQFLMAIVSYGKDCGRMDPAVNTNVSSYLNWIVTAHPNVEFCRRIR